MAAGSAGGPSGRGMQEMALSAFGGGVRKKKDALKGVSIFFVCKLYKTANGYGQNFCRPPYRGRLLKSGAP